MKSERTEVLGAVIAAVLIVGLVLCTVVSAAEYSRWQKVRSEAFSKLGDIPHAGKPLRIGAIIITEANPFWVTVKEGYIAAANDLGVQMDVQAAPQENSIAAQLDIMENMVAKHYDAIAAHSITRHNLIPGLVKAAQQGIPTITDSIRDGPGRGFGRRR
ncbi:MAG: substrate-binding domain-containing protein [Pseudomonadota bacterium]